MITIQNQTKVGYEQLKIILFFWIYGYNVCSPWCLNIVFRAEKMKNGIPLSDEDRIPWLETLRDCLKTSIENGETVIMGCSALQQHYREILRSADKNYKPGSGCYICVVKFVLLDAPEEVLSSRLEKRCAEGNHFMPAKLLQSQIDLLQIDESEGIIKVDATAEPRILVDMIQSLIVKPHLWKFLGAIMNHHYVKHIVLSGLNELRMLLLLQRLLILQTGQTECEHLFENFCLSNYEAMDLWCHFLYMSPESRMRNLHLSHLIPPRHICCSNGTWKCYRGSILAM